MLIFNHCYKEFQLIINADPIVMNILKDETFPKNLEDWDNLFVIKSFIYCVYSLEINSFCCF